MMYFSQYRPPVFFHQNLYILMIYWLCWTQTLMYLISYMFSDIADIRECADMKHYEISANVISQLIAIGSYCSILAYTISSSWPDLKSLH